MIRHSRISLVCFLFLASLFANAQYTDVAAMNDLGGPKEFAARRAELAGKLEDRIRAALRQDAGSSQPTTIAKTTISTTTPGCPIPARSCS